MTEITIVTNSLNKYFNVKFISGNILSTHYDCDNNSNKLYSNQFVIEHNKLDIIGQDI